MKRRRGSFSRVAFPAIFLVVASVSGLRVTEARAQTGTTGAIFGTVSDRTGGVLPKVKVSATNVETGLARETQTDSDGAYAFLQLTAGRYRLQYVLAGFQELTRENVTVRSAAKLTLNVNMEVGALTQHVVVEIGAELVQAHDSAIAKVLDESILRLPLATRNFLQLQLTVPGVTANVADTADLGRGSINVSVNGARFTNNNIMLEGIDVNNAHTNSARNNAFGSNGVPVPALEAVREVQIQTSLYDAQWGRNGGANTNVLFRTGSNDWHGGLYYFFRNEKLNANNFFFNQTGTKRPILRQNLYGGYVGGAIRHNKTFFFLSFQGARQFNGASLSSSVTQLSLPAIPADRSAASLGRVFGGQAGARGGVAVAPNGSNINPVALALLNAKLPNGNFVIASPQKSGTGTNFTASIPARYREEQFTVALDHLFSETNKASGRFFWAQTPQERAFAGSSLPGFGLTQFFTNRFVSLTHQKTFSPHVVNDFRFGMNRLPGRASPSEPVTDQQVGISRFNNAFFAGIPLLTVRDQFSLGSTTNNDQATTYTSFTWGDTLSYTRGKHNFRTGLEIRRHRTNLFNNFASRGFLTFTTFPDFLLGMNGGPVATGGNGSGFSNLQDIFVGSGNTKRQFRVLDWSVFLQDDWKLTPRLTLNLGLRYDFFGAVTDLAGRIGNFDPALYQPAPVGGSSSAGFIVAGNFPGNLPGVPKVADHTLRQEDHKDIEPRFGFAYRPFRERNVVVRGGYGIFFERTSNQTTLQLLTSAPFFQLFRQVNGSAGTFQAPFPILPTPPQFPVQPVFFSPPFTAARPTITVNNVDRGLRAPYVQQFNLGVQYEFAKDWLVDISYVGSKGTRLPTTRQANQALLASAQNPVNGQTTNTTANTQLRVPFLGFSSSGLNQVETSTTSFYNSMQIAVSKRLGHGLQLSSYYVFSKSLDTTSGGTESLLGSISGDQNNVLQAHGRSIFDVRHKANISAYYQIPAFGGAWNRTGVGSRVFRGWEILAQYTARSGLPITIDDTNGATLFGVTTSRASFAPGKSLGDAIKSGRVQDRLNAFFNTSAFISSGTLFGNTGRGLLSGPKSWNVDFSAVKRTAITERHTVEWRAEMFNLFNHPNFDQPVSNRASGNFGKILATITNARVIQFALKYSF